MDGNKSKKPRIEGKSLTPFKKRSEKEMISIVSKIKAGQLSIRNASIRYGLNRNTLRFFMRKTEVLSLGESSNQITPPNMSDLETIAALKKQLSNLNKALEQSRAHVEALDTMISIAEKTFDVSIRKKYGSKQFQK